jgi:hypothetical protein
MVQVKRLIRITNTFMSSTCESLHIKNELFLRAIIWVAFRQHFSRSIQGELLKCESVYMTRRYFFALMCAVYTIFDIAKVSFYNWI